MEARVRDADTEPSPSKFMQLAKLHETKREIVLFRDLDPRSEQGSARVFAADEHAVCKQTFETARVCDQAVAWLEAP